MKEPNLLKQVIILLSFVILNPGANLFINTISLLNLFGKLERFTIVKKISFTFNKWSSLQKWVSKFLMLLKPKTDYVNKFS